MHFANKCNSSSNYLFMGLWKARVWVISSWVNQHVWQEKRNWEQHSGITHSVCSWVAGLWIDTQQCKPEGHQAWLLLHKVLRRQSMDTTTQVWQELDQQLFGFLGFSYINTYLAYLEKISRGNQVWSYCFTVVEVQASKVLLSFSILSFIKM